MPDTVGIFRPAQRIPPGWKQAVYRSNGKHHITIGDVHAWWLPPAPATKPESAIQSGCLTENRFKKELLLAVISTLIRTSLLHESFLRERRVATITHPIIHQMPYTRLVSKWHRKARPPSVLLVRQCCINTAFYRTDLTASVLSFGR